MRLIAILMATLVFQWINAQNTSLKIQTGEDAYYYPSNLEFEVMDKDGNTQFSEKDLTKDEPIILEGVYTIHVYTTWADGKDSFKVNDKASIALAKNKTYVNYKEKDMKPWHKNKPKLIDTDFKKNNGKFDAIIAFENDIYFNYIDGKASITEDGKSLELVGTYVAKTSKGYLKMSYVPETKEFWYVFTDTYKKVVYQ